MKVQPKKKPTIYCYVQQPRMLYSILVIANRRSTPEQRLDGVEPENMINYYHQLQRWRGEWLVVSCAIRLHIFYKWPRIASTAVTFVKLLAWTHHRNRHRLVRRTYYCIVRGARMMPATYSGQLSTHVTSPGTCCTKVGKGRLWLSGKGFLPGHRMAKDLCESWSCRHLHNIIMYSVRRTANLLFYFISFSVEPSHGALE